MRNSKRPRCAHLLSSSQSASRKWDTSYRAHVHLAPSIHMSCGEQESECAGRSRNGGKWRAGAGASSGRGIVPAEKRPWDLIILNDRYLRRGAVSTRSTWECGRGSYILRGRKLDKRASASWPIGRRLLRVALSDRWYAPSDDERIPRPSCVSWTEKKYRRAGSTITVSQLRSTIRPCFPSELCVHYCYRSYREYLPRITAEFHDAHDASH